MIIDRMESAGHLEWQTKLVPAVSKLLDIASTAEPLRQRLAAMMRKFIQQSLPKLESLPRTAITGNQLEKALSFLDALGGLGLFMSDQDLGGLLNERCVLNEQLPDFVRLRCLPYGVYLEDLRVEDAVYAILKRHLINGPSHRLRQTCHDVLAQGVFQFLYQKPGTEDVGIDHCARRREIGKLLSQKVHEDLAQGQHRDQDWSTIYPRWQLFLNLTKDIDGIMPHCDLEVFFDEAKQRVQSDPKVKHFLTSYMERTFPKADLVQLYKKYRPDRPHYLVEKLSFEGKESYRPTEEVRRFFAGRLGNRDLRTVFLQNHHHAALMSLYGIFVAGNEYLVDDDLLKPMWGLSQESQ